MKLTNDEILQENINITKQYVKDHGGKVSSLPTATADLVGQIYQYTGTTTSTYTHGYFYECKNNGGTYSWENIPTGGSTDVDAYHSSDTAETSIADNDYIPFYDTSASSKKKSLWSNIKSVLKTYFDGIYITSHQDISGKADKVTSATNGNFAGLDSNGNLTDSGSKASDFAASSQAVPSGGTTGQVLAKVSGTDYDTEWVTPSGGSGGHTILNASGTAMTQRGKLQFVGGNVKDDSTNDKTVVTVDRELTQAEYDALSTAEQNNGTNYFITDAPSSYTGVPQSMIGDAWVVSHAYAVGDYCIDGNVLYKCKTAHTSTASNKPPYTSYWEPVSVASEFQKKKIIKIDSVAPNTSSYASISLPTGYTFDDLDIIAYRKVEVSGSHIRCLIDFALTSVSDFKNTTSSFPEVLANDSGKWMALYYKNSTSMYVMNQNTSYYLEVYGIKL